MNDSYNMQTPKFCSNCGAKLDAGQKFCHSCGQMLSASVQPSYIQEPPVSEPQPVYNQEPSDTQFEAQQFDFTQHQAQDHQQYQHTQEPKTEKPRKPKKKIKDSIMRVLGSSLMLVLAVMMLLSSFLPLVNWKITQYDYSEEKTKNVYVKFNAIDIIKISINSFDSIDDEEMIEESEEIRDDYEEYTEDWYEGRRLNKYAEFLKKAVMLSVKQEEVPSTIMFAVAGALALLQIVLSSVLVIVAIVKFFAALTGRGRALSKAPYMLFGLSSVFMFVNIFMFKRISTIIMSALSSGKTLVSSWISIMHIVIVVAMAVMLIVRIIDKPFPVRVKECIKRPLSIAFAVMLLLSAFMPILKVDIKAEFNDTDRETTVTAPLNSDVFLNFELSESEKESYEEAHSQDTVTPAQDLFSDLEYYTKREMKKDSGGAYLENMSMFSFLVLCGGAYEYSFLFAIGTVAVIFVIFAALFIIWQNVCDFSTRRKTSSGITALIKTLTILMSLVVLALSIVMMVIANYNAEFAEINYLVKLAAGPILMAVAAIGVASVPEVKRRELKEKD